MDVGNRRPAWSTNPAEDDRLRTLRAPPEAPMPSSVTPSTTDVDVDAVFGLSRQPANLTTVAPPPQRPRVVATDEDPLASLFSMKPIHEDDDEPPPLSKSAATVRPMSAEKKPQATAPQGRTNVDQALHVAAQAIRTYDTAALATGHMTVGGVMENDTVADLVDSPEHSAGKKDVEDEDGKPKTMGQKARAFASRNAASLASFAAAIGLMTNPLTLLPGIAMLLGSIGTMKGKSGNTVAGWLRDILPTSGLGQKLKEALPEGLQKFIDTPGRDQKGIKGYVKKAMEAVGRNGGPAAAALAGVALLFTPAAGVGVAMLMGGALNTKDSDGRTLWQRIRGSTPGDTAKPEAEGLAQQAKGEEEMTTIPSGATTTKPNSRPAV